MGPENTYDIIFVPFLMAKAVYHAVYTYRIEDISLGLCTNITEAHFLTECASKCVFWQGQKDLNPRHAVLETAALPTELYPYILNFHML